MFESTLYRLTIRAIPKVRTLQGEHQPGNDFRVRLLWDDVEQLSAVAYSPEGLGRIVGEAVRAMAEHTDRTLSWPDRRGVEL